MCRAAKRQVLRCKAEVILAGGAINSPQLLQLSGIGPGALLQGLGMPVLSATTRMWATI